MSKPSDWIDRLPARLAERCTARNDLTITPAGRDFVLYWMRTAVRGHQNPALDVGLTIAAQIGRPLLVYQGVTEHYPFASDRHHAFLVGGARDASIELRERGIRHVCHVERPAVRGPFLRQLAARAAVVVTVDLPVPPLAGWTRSLAATVPNPVWTVDTACVVPMPLVCRPTRRRATIRSPTASACRSRARWCGSGTWSTGGSAGSGSQRRTKLAAGTGHAAGLGRLRRTMLVDQWSLISGSA